VFESKRVTAPAILSICSYDGIELMSKVGFGGIRDLFGFFNPFIDGDPIVVTNASVIVSNRLEFLKHFVHQFCHIQKVNIVVGQSLVVGFFESCGFQNGSESFPSHTQGWGQAEQ